jgi:hypothetical protein
VAGTAVSLDNTNDNITISSVDASDRSNIDGKISTLNTNIGGKQATLSNGDAFTNSQALLSGDKIKNLIPGLNMSMPNNTK